ncbi:MAG TPA: Asp-tRNA(Asn)/Glu-tRNA(Gln) amidotransferase GatCAB subunit A, partial [Clostridia bacterium]
MTRRIEPAAGIAAMTALETGRRLQSGELGAVEALRAILDRIAAVGPLTNSYVYVNEEEAMAMAAAAQRKIDAARAAGET